MPRYLFLIFALIASACAAEDTPDSEEKRLSFEIDAEMRNCEGVAPRRCLVVNGALFYDNIKGYQHVEGQAAQICVLRTLRPEPLPADVGRYIYTRVECDGTKTQS